MYAPHTDKHTGNRRFRQHRLAGEREKKSRRNKRELEGTSFQLESCSALSWGKLVFGDGGDFKRC